MRPEWLRQLDGTVAPDLANKMYFYEEIPTDPNEGDTTFIQGTLNVWDGLHWVPVAVTPDPSFIIDADGNKIMANRTVTIAQDVDPVWTITDGTNTYTLTGEKTHARWNDGEKKYETYIAGNDAWVLKYYEMPIPGLWVSKWWEQVSGTESSTYVRYPQHGFTATWAKPTTSDVLATMSDLPTKTSDLTNDSGFITANDIPAIPSKTSELTNDSGFITSADVPTKTSDLTNDSGFITTDEVLPFHNPTTPTVNTGLANKAYRLALNDPTDNGQPLADGTFSAIHRNTRDLTDVFAAGFDFNTYWPYELTQFNGQTYDPSLELKFCKDKLTFLRQGRPRQVYSGWMFRTSGAGFAIPCSEDATPAGTLYETTRVEANYVLVSSETPHTIGFTSYGSDEYNHIVSLDGQEGMIAAYRAGNIKTKSINETLANKSDLPTKTSDLTNDSGFITSADIITKRDLNDFNVYVDPMADMTTTKFTVVISYAGDPTYPIFTVELTHQGGEATTWVWSPSGSNHRISIDYSSVTGVYDLHYYNLQDGGGNEHSGSMTTPLTSPYWTGEAQDDWFHFSITSQTTTITTKAYVDSLIAQLSARITALENNNQ